MSSKIVKFPELSDEEIEQDLLPNLLQWSLANGLIMYPPNYSIEQSTPVTMTLFPTPFPRGCFLDAVDVQLAYNTLYAVISQDKDGWLSRESEILSHTDPDFTGQLWNLFCRAKAYGIPQKIGLGIFRSDYFVDKNSVQLKQVEFNTVSVSFGGLSGKICELHRYLNGSGRYSNDGGEFYDLEQPLSTSAESLAEGIAIAVDKYNEISRTHQTIVAFIVQNDERNVFDQRILEYNLFKHHNIKSCRLTLHEIHEKTKTDATSRRLYLNATNQEISVVYFRAGYSPADFSCDQDWENRLSLETSLAIKAPNLLTQLSGTKKIQQLLTSSSVLTRFVSEEVASKLSPTFVKMYPLDDTEMGKIGRALALNEPENYVLKPQREGGGNNIYKKDIPTFLTSISEQEWSGYVLMELINPLETTGNVIIRGQEIHRSPILSELGVFGTILFDDEQIYSNKYAGWLLRSKFSYSNEGGVAAGFGCVDSVVLY
ncbi:glutathione synthase Ecym_2643 [Eremothecium cymbalariae DBVPG|uniref:Glutathione synthetase n=1 Tax=Eremothecium cymbalariae (strain CBS 270.75 / DBVPG 7215 / KCTC 17166 / NRRL Y-17582) TaxID=931890 RepID=G8JNT0_ERECY|nr:Hypothetical protein Ecym_2643 [Eremothecium cymbalariae DBVPG\